MSGLGKILAFLNVLAALGFVYVATVDLGKRQAWSYAVLRHDLAIQGLPVDDEEHDTEGNALVDELNSATLTQVFQPAGGTPVKTQTEEVKRVYTNLQGRIDTTAADPILNGTKGQRLARCLLPLARSAPRREELQRRIDDPNAKTPPDEALQAEFDRAFQDALQKKRDPQEKRQVIATLLFDTVELITAGNPAEQNADALDTNAYKRYLVVVGLTEAVRELEAQSVTLQELTADVNQAADRDRGTFAVAHKKGLLDLQVLAKQLEDRKLFLAKQQAIATENQQVVNQRQVEVTEMKAKLDKARTDTVAELDKQTQMEKQLFDSQQRLNKASSTNQRLEREIRKLEQER